MKKETIWILSMALAMSLLVSTVVGAFDTPSEEYKDLPPAYDYGIDFGLMNATGTTSEKVMDRGRVYCSWSFTSDRLGTGDIVLHVQAAMDLGTDGTWYGWANITDAAGQTITTDTETLKFNIPKTQNRCGRATRLKIESGADAFGNSLTNTVLFGLVD